MTAEEINRKSLEIDDGEIELPLINITEGDVYGALLVHTSYNETFNDSILKLQTWIMNFSEEQIAPLRDSGKFTDDELEDIKKKICVISPMTMALYIHWLQMESFIKLPDSEKEKILLEKIPDRFKARYKGNASNRQAREVSSTEEAEKIVSESVCDKEDFYSETFHEYLKKLGAEILEEKNQFKKGA